MLPLYSGLKGKEEEITTSLWILDSKDNGCEDIAQSYACFNKMQQDWVVQKSE